MAKDDVINVLPVDTKAEFKDFLRFGSDILEGTVKGVIHGVAGTAEDAFKSTVELCKGNVGEAAKIAVDRVTNIGIGTLRLFKVAWPSLKPPLSLSSKTSLYHARKPNPSHASLPIRCLCCRRRSACE